MLLKSLHKDIPADVSAPFDAAHVPATNPAGALATLLMLKALMLLASFILLITSPLLPVFFLLPFCIL
jgi:hypothetical protein